MPEYVAKLSPLIAFLLRLLVGNFGWHWLELLLKKSGGELELVVSWCKLLNMQQNVLVALELQTWPILIRCVKN